MSRVLLLNMTAELAKSKLAQLGIGISTIESLTSGGIRLVCMSSQGAETARSEFSSKLIRGDVVRVRHRPEPGVR